MGGRGERLLQAEEVGSFALRNAKSQLGGSTKKKKNPSSAQESGFHEPWKRLLWNFRDKK